MPGFIINGTGAGPDGGPDGRGEIRRTYRWMFRLLDGFPQRDAFLYLKTAQRPNMTLEEIQQNHNQERIYHAGQTSWEACNISWYDMETPVDCSEAVYEWLNVSVYEIPAANVQHPQTYKRNAGLDVTNHLGERTESWRLYHAWPQNINWNELDYSNNDALLINATIRFDRAEKIA